VVVERRSTFRRRLGSLIVLLAIATASLAVAVPAQARHAIGPRQVKAGRVAMFPGQIMNLTGPASSPTGFTLQTAQRSIDFRIAPRRTRFTARSAEALVDGFSVDDFATVSATRVNGEWVANHVVYDVVPWGPIRLFTVSGTVLRLDRIDNRFLVKLSTGDTHWIVTNKGTKYLIDGQPSAGPVALTREEAVQVQVHRNQAGRWIALTIAVVQGGSI
jgi:hypothetical protein